MARRKKRFGAVTGRTGPRKVARKSLSVSVEVFRRPVVGYYIGNEYQAVACPKGAARKVTSKKCGLGHGSTATRAISKALSSLGAKLLK